MAGKKKSIFIKVIVGVLIVFVTAGITWQVAVRSFSGDKYLLTKEQFDRFSQYQKIDELIANVNKNYYTDVSEDDLINGAYKGVVWGTGDRYSEYLNQDEMEAYNRLASGKFYGIGVIYTINSELGYPEIKETVKNSPAQKAGVESGDIILRVDGNNVQGYNTEKMNETITGEKGTKVSIQVRRGDEEKAFEMEREAIEEEVVLTRALEGNIGYVRLTQFTGGCADKVEKALKELQKQGCISFILDMRNNSGGLLSEAIKIADFLMPEGRIAYTKNKEGVEEVHDSKAGSFGKPLVILVNERTASSAEIVAGAVQNAKTAKLVGTTTYGKGVVQKLYPLTDGKSWIKLTNSVYYLADGETPNEKGITPDVVVEMDVKNTFDPDKDTQLKKAIALFQ